MVNILLSGFAGALFAQVSTLLWWMYKHHKECTSLLNGLVAECEYNISIIDEILEGVVERKGSFKRLSTEYFRMIREASVKYSFSSELIKALSRVIVDMDLFNLETSYVFNGHNGEQEYTGKFGNGEVHVTRKPKSINITEIISNAREGVVASLKTVKRIASEG